MDGAFARDTAPARKHYPRCAQAIRQRAGVRYQSCPRHRRTRSPQRDARAVDVKRPTQRKSAGFPVWTEDDVERYEAHWPIGSKERVWLGVLLYTGLRRGDAVRLGRQHVRDNVATIRTEKSRGEITVTLPILPALDEILQVGPCGDLAFICGERGQPLTKESFGNLFRDACNAAGVAKSAHGVRKIGATRAANNGATVAELEAIFGWSGGGMASLYTRAADRARLASREAFTGETTGRVLSCETGLTP
jgi:integrase